MLPDTVWDQIEEMEAGLRPGGSIWSQRGCGQLALFGAIAFLLFGGAIGALVGLYFAAGQPCLPGQSCNVPAETDVAGACVMEGGSLCVQVPPGARPLTRFPAPPHFRPAARFVRARACVLTAKTVCQALATCSTCVANLGCVWCTVTSTSHGAPPPSLPNGESSV